MSKSKHQNKAFDFILFITVLILLALGITMVLSASSPSALALTGSSYTYVKKQFFCAIIGIILMLIISKIDYKKYQKFYKISYFLSAIILLLVLVPGLGRTMNGARRWIKVPFITSFQPSELTKLGLILFFAGYLTKHKDELSDLKKGFFKPIIFFVLPIAAILILVQSHLSACIVIVVVVSIMMIVGGSKILHFLSFGLAGGGCALGGLYFLAKEYGIGAYRLQRLVSFLDPWADAQGAGWQSIQSLYAIGSRRTFWCRPWK